VARVETDREDLFAEAVTLVRRVEGCLPTFPIAVLVGAKSNGDVSFYFGPDRVYHCDASGRFRRAFVEGLLYRSQGNSIGRLRRDRTETETALLRNDLTVDELDEFRSAMHEHLRSLQMAITSGVFAVLRREPVDDVDFEVRIAAIIETILSASPWLAPALVVRR
jgi:hypothetical protein